MSGLHTHQRSRGNFVEHTIEGLHAALARAMYADTPQARPACCSGSTPG